jgi:AraC-like DNA-binding protein
VKQIPERSGLSPERLKQLVSLADKEVRRSKYFLDPQINIYSLSRKVGTNRSYLSQAIAFGHGINFCSYVNQLRIEEILQSGGHALMDEDALYSFALVCGFNNRRTFYRAFLRETGMLPADFVARYKRLPLQQ